MRPASPPSGADGRSSSCGGPHPPRGAICGNALGKQLTVQESPWITLNIVAINTEKKPFDDSRVRRALSLAVDRWGASREISRVTWPPVVGGILRPGSELAASEAELTRLAGFGKDIEASRREARRLLKEAGVPEGFTFTFKNRDVKVPYEPVGPYFIDQWRKLGLNVRHVVQETGPYVADLRSGNYETNFDFDNAFMDEPDLQLAKYLSSDRSPTNFGRYKDPRLDEHVGELLGDLAVAHADDIDPSDMAAPLVPVEHPANDAAVADREDLLGLEACARGGPKEALPEGADRASAHEPLAVRRRQRVLEDAIGGHERHHPFDVVTVECRVEASDGVEGGLGLGVGHGGHLPDDCARPSCSRAWSRSVRARSVSGASGSPGTRGTG
jgi:hypothetical protein